MELNPKILLPILSSDLPIEMPVDGIIEIEAGHVGKPPIDIVNVLRPLPPPPPPPKTK